LLCKKFNCQRTVFPDDDKKLLRFSAHKNQQRLPFVVYADFECFTEPYEESHEKKEEEGEEDKERKEADQRSQATSRYQKHVPSGFAYYVVSDEPSYNRGPILYRWNENDQCNASQCRSSFVTRTCSAAAVSSSDSADQCHLDISDQCNCEKYSPVVSKFFDCLIDEEKRIELILSEPLKLEKSLKVEKAYFMAHKCWICDKRLHGDRVRDHCHLTGRFRGIAHSACNLKLRWPKLKPTTRYGFRIPVFFHNLRGYDSHFLMHSFGKYKHRQLSCIANNSEKFLTLSSGAISFVDSFQFMASSLSSLVENLAATAGTVDTVETKFEHLFRVCKHLSKEQKCLLLRKGVFPYDFFNHPDVFELTKLPAKEEFFSELNMEGISTDDYSHAQRVWKEFKCKTFGHYHDIYLALDVMQLADVFENFRHMSMRTYKLDPAHYITAPGLTWDAMLK
jgi:hypothetical protein